MLVQESCVSRSCFLSLCLTGGTDLLFDPLVLEGERTLGRNWLLWCGLPLGLMYKCFSPKLLCTEHLLKQLASRRMPVRASRITFRKAELFPEATSSLFQENICKYLKLHLHYLNQGQKSLPFPVSVQNVSSQQADGER